LANKVVYIILSAAYELSPVQHGFLIFGAMAVSLTTGVFFQLKPVRTHKALFTVEIGSYIKEMRKT